MAILEQIKMLEDDTGTFIDQLERAVNSTPETVPTMKNELSDLRKEKADAEKKMEGLVDSRLIWEIALPKNHVAKVLSSSIRNV